MSNLVHVKLVSPAPAEVDAFLREVAGLPAGWAFVPTDQGVDDSDPDNNITWEQVMHFRGASRQTGYIVGTPKTRQVQILQGDRPHIWAVALGTRDLEGAHRKCMARGMPVTEMRVTDFHGSMIRAFFARVGGIIFEMIRVED